MNTKDFANIAQALQKLLGEGKIIPAIRLLRTTGIGLKEAKDVIDRLMQQMDAGDQANTNHQSAQPLHQQYGDNDDQDDASYDPPERYQKQSYGGQKYGGQSYQHSHRHSLEKDLPTEVYLLLQRGEKLEAIKSLRAIKGYSLAQANNMVKQFYHINPQYDDGSSLQSKGKRSWIEYILIAGVVLFLLRNVLD